MKIYTKTGDRGTTSLMGGKRVDKSDLRIKAYGEVDELNSLIGLIIADLADYHLSLRAKRSNLLIRHSSLSRIDSGVASLPRMTRNTLEDFEKKLLRIQNELLVLGSDLATPLNVKIKVPRVTKSFITRLEKEIDKSFSLLK